MSTGLTAERV